MADAADLQHTIKNIRQRAASNKSKFLEHADKLDVEMLARHYDELRREAPKRHTKNRQYLFQRSGIPSSGSGSNRGEEHLAIALFGKYRKPNAMVLPDGQRLQILDYQVPLKAAGSDAAVGKVDMLGLIDDERLAILELKFKGGDAPLGATLEALVYAAIIEANGDDIADEMQSDGYARPKSECPEIIILAREDYWRDFEVYDKDWINKLEPNLRRITSNIPLRIRFLALETGELEMGRDGTSPRLDGDVKIRSLLSSPES